MYIYIINIHHIHTCIMQTKTFILDAIHRLTAVKRLHQCFFFFNVTILFKKCAHDKFGLKIVGTGACLHGVASPLLFKTV